MKPNQIRILSQIFFMPTRLDFKIRKISSTCIRLSETKSSSEIVVRSTFNRQTRIFPNVNYLQKSDKMDSNLNLYCCGPTVYDDSHLGHAISYIRCDLVVRMLKIFCNTNVYFAMNITDIDDKIINKSNEIGLDYRELSEKYYKSFIEDLNSLNVTPPDFVGKVKDNVDVIGEYIKQIYDKGYAYISPETGDINFDYKKFISDYSIDNAMNFGSDQITTKSRGKRSPKDFVLWKCPKPNEPQWNLKLNDETTIRGRPGWHVECSALSNMVFGSKIDIHFGGFDLIFPHHHCESCCSHVYQNHPNTSNKLYSSAFAWLHSGHLILRSEKMSKSLGNVVLIKDFLKEYPPNILRLLCIRLHYRSEIDFDEKLLIEMTAYDEKLREFIRHIEWAIYKLSNSSTYSSSSDLMISQWSISETCMVDGENQQRFSQKGEDSHSSTLIQWINNVENSIWKGILDDFDFNLGLTAIINLAKIFPKALPIWYDHQKGEDSLLLYQCIRLKVLMQRWLEAAALDYGLNTSSLSSCSFSDQMAIVEHLTEFRSQIRQSTLDMLKRLKKNNGPQPQPQSKQQPTLPTIQSEEKNQRQPQQEQQHLIQQEMKKILAYCDQTRTFLERRGIKLKDQKSALSSSKACD